MFKLVLLAVWINLAAIAAVFFSSGKYENLMGSKESAGEKSANTKTAALPPITVALIRDTGVAGYFIIEVVFTYEDGKSTAKLPFEFYFRNAIVDAIYGNEDIDENQLQYMDLDLLRSQIIEDLAEKIGKNIVHDVLIQSVDYRSIDEVRDKILRRLSQ